MTRTCIAAKNFFGHRLGAHYLHHDRDHERRRHPSCAGSDYARQSCTGHDPVYIPEVEPSAPEPSSASEVECVNGCGRGAQFGRVCCLNCSATGHHNPNCKPASEPVPSVPEQPASVGPTCPHDGASAREHTLCKTHDSHIYLHQCTRKHPRWIEGEAWLRMPPVAQPEPTANEHERRMLPSTEIPYVSVESDHGHVPPIERTVLRAARRVGGVPLDEVMARGPWREIVDQYDPPDENGYRKYVGGRIGRVVERNDRIHGAAADIVVGIRTEMREETGEVT